MADVVPARVFYNMLAFVTFKVLGEVDLPVTMY